MSKTGTCALCKQDHVPLISSHIVSRWLYRRIIKIHGGGEKPPVEVSGGKIRYQSKQEQQYLLCKPCELIFCESEKYVAEISLHEEGSFPLREKARIVDGDAKLAEIHIADIDYDKFTHFALSVFWRADVAQIEPIVHLGVDNLETRNYLRHLGPLPTSMDLRVIILNPPPNLPGKADRVFSFPQTQEDRSDEHEFFLFGLWATLYTSNSFPNATNKLSFSRDHKIFMYDGQKFRDVIVENIKNSERVGKIKDEDD